MARSLGIVLMTLPVMSLSFYGTHMVMQSQVIQSQKPLQASSVLPSSSQVATLQTEQFNAAPIQKVDIQQVIVKQPSKPVKLAKQPVPSDKVPSPIEQSGSPKSAHKAVQAVIPKRITLSEQTPQPETAKPEVVAQLSPKAFVQRQASKQKVMQLSQADLDITPADPEPAFVKPASEATKVSGSDPYIDEIAPEDMKQASLLLRASTQSHWEKNLVTSAFEIKKSAEEIAKEKAKEKAVLQAAVALTPRILPSGRTFGGFTEREFQKRELRCMATGLYFEARSEPVRGQLAVGQVIMNRVRSPDYPDTICGVIFQGDHRRTGCQFSFACDGKTDRPTNKRLWLRSQRLARQLTDGKVWLKDIANSTHYHADYVHPRWRRSMRKLKKIGRHIFYKSPKISTTNTFQAVRG